jgi:hypothetical protein
MKLINFITQFFVPVLLLGQVHIYLPNETCISNIEEFIIDSEYAVVHKPTEATNPVWLSYDYLEEPVSYDDSITVHANNSGMWHFYSVPYKIMFVVSFRTTNISNSVKRQEDKYYEIMKFKNVVLNKKYDTR